MKQTAILSTSLNDPNFVTDLGNPSWITELTSKFWIGIQKLKEIWKWTWSLWIWEMISRFAQGLFNLLFAGPPMQEQIEQARVKAMQYRGVF
jgi:hypothetical protein